MKGLWARKKSAKNRAPKLMEGQGGYLFRRSRTLTGSTSVQVSPTASERGQLKTDRLKLHQSRAARRRQLRRVAVLGCVTFFILFLNSNIIWQPSISYSEKGLRQPDGTKYAQSIQAYFNDHPFERFSFLLSTAGLGEHISKQHNEIAGITTDKAWYGGEVSFKLYFRQPLLVWKSGGRQFYVDGQGIAFTYNHFAEPALAVTDQSGIPPDASGAIASTRFIAFLGQLIGTLNTQGQGRVESVVVPASTREVDIKLSGRSYLVKAESDRDPLEQAQDIAFALRFLDQKKITPQYVDVRVAHKAFYK